MNKIEYLFCAVESANSEDVLMYDRHVYSGLSVLLSFKKLTALWGGHHYFAKERTEAQKG